MFNASEYALSCAGSATAAVALVQISRLVEKLRAVRMRKLFMPGAKKGAVVHAVYPAIDIDVSTLRENSRSFRLGDNQTPFITGRFTGDELPGNGLMRISNSEAMDYLSPFFHRMGCRIARTSDLKLQGMQAFETNIITIGGPFTNPAALFVLSAKGNRDIPFRFEKGQLFYRVKTTNGESGELVVPTGPEDALEHDYAGIFRLSNEQNGASCNWIGCMGLTGFATKAACYFLTRCTSELREHLLPPFKRKFPFSMVKDFALTVQFKSGSEDSGKLRHVAKID